METSEQKFQLRSRESRRRAATEVDGFGRYRETRALLIEVAQYCFTKSPRLRAIEQIFVKRARRADSRAERNVNVKVIDRSYCSGRRVACIRAWFRSRNNCHDSVRVVVRTVRPENALVLLHMTKL